MSCNTKRPLSKDVPRTTWDSLSYTSHTAGQTRTDCTVGPGGRLLRARNTPPPPHSLRIRRLHRRHRGSFPPSLPPPLLLRRRPPLSSAALWNGEPNNQTNRAPEPAPARARLALVHSARPPAVLCWDGKPTRRGEGFSVGRARCVAMQCSMRLCGRPTVPVDTNDRLREKFTLGVKETPSIVRILSPEPTVAGRRARRGTLTGGRACVFLRTYVRMCIVCRNGRGGREGGRRGRNSRLEVNQRSEQLLAPSASARPSVRASDRQCRAARIPVVVAGTAVASAAAIAPITVASGL